MKVLVVEDDPIFGMLIARLIKPYLSADDHVTVVKNLAEADQYLDINGPADLTTLDLNLPGSRWDKTVDQIERFKGKKGCVLVISGVQELGVDKISRDRGADGFIAKPFNEKGFISNLRDMLRSLVSTPERYKPYERILSAINDNLEKGNFD